MRSQDYFRRFRIINIVRTTLLLLKDIPTNGKRSLHKKVGNTCVKYLDECRSDFLQRTDKSTSKYAYLNIKAKSTCETVTWGSSMHQPEELYLVNIPKLSILASSDQKILQGKLTSVNKPIQNVCFSGRVFLLISDDKF